MDPKQSDLREKRRRAKAACLFCRRRKIRCTQELPSCSNCQVYEENCSYDMAPKKPRPSNSRIANLEDKIKHLEEQLEEARSTSNRRESSETDSSSADDINASRFSSPNPHDKRERPGYHGPTAVLFDESFPDDKRSMRSGSEQSGSGVFTTNLMGEAAVQRKSLLCKTDLD